MNLPFCSHDPAVHGLTAREVPTGGVPGCAIGGDPGANRSAAASLACWPGRQTLRPEDANGKVARCSLSHTPLGICPFTAVKGQLVEE